MRWSGTLPPKKLAFKVQPILDNAHDHPEGLQFAHPNVEVVFIPPKMTSLLQPMDQGVIATFKGYDTRHTFSPIFDAMESDETVTVVECWKNYNITDCISIIKDFVVEVKPSMLNACWGKLWREAVNDFQDFPSVDPEVKHIVRIVDELPGEGLTTMQHNDMDELLELHVELTEDDLEELVQSSSDEDEDKVEIIKMTRGNLSKGMLAASNLADHFMEVDPFMEHSLIFKQELEELMRPYKVVHRDLQTCLT